MLIHSLLFSVVGCVAVTAAEAGVVRLDFSGETVGAVSTTMPPLVGQWVVAADDKNQVLKVDGQQWKREHVPENLAATAAVLFAAGGVGFAERIRATPAFPLAVVPAVTDFRNGTISVRFKPLAGSEDQAAGIAFNLGVKADYLLVRANALEHNIGFFQVVNGSRQTIKWVEKTPTPTNQWHTLSITVTGTELAVSLDGTAYLKHILSAPVTGKVALWSKEDSVVLFDDLTVTPSLPAIPKE